MTHSEGSAPTVRDGWLFLLLALSLSSLIWSGLFFIDPANNPWAGGGSMSPPLLALFLGGGAVPSLLGLAFALRRGGWPACRRLLGKLLPQHCSFGLVVIALVLPILAALVARWLGEAFGAQPPPIDFAAVPRAAAMALAAGLMEELGWRGTALPALSRRYGLLWGGLIVGLAWALWHTVGGIWSVAPFFQTWFAAYYLTGIIGTMLGAGLTLAVLWQRGGGGLFAVLAFHLAFSASANIVTPSAGAPQSAVLIASFFALAHLLIGAAAIALFGREQPSLRPVSPLPHP